MKTKHYYRFEENVQKKMEDNSLNQDNWDILRNDKEESVFSLEKDVESYERNCSNSVSYQNAAKKIVELIKKYNFQNKKIISLGCGKGILEWHIKEMMPDITVECTDYTEKAINQLKQVFVKIGDAYTFDMLNGSYDKLDTDALFIMYRVSTEFSMDDWNKIFEKMYKANIEHIIFAPAGLDTFMSMLKENICHIVNVICGRKDIFCGWLYSENEFFKMFHNKTQSPMYIVKEKIAISDTAIYLLEREPQI